MADELARGMCQIAYHTCKRCPPAKTIALIVIAVTAIFCANPGGRRANRREVWQPVWFRRVLDRVGFHCSANNKNLKFKIRAQTGAVLDMLRPLSMTPSTQPSGIITP